MEVSKEDKEKLNKAISYLYKADVEFKGQKKIFEGKKEKANEVINRLLNKYEINSVSINKAKEGFAPAKLLCKRIVRRSVDFDCDMLEEKLGKETCLEFMSKEYTINDMDGLIKLLKNAGVKPSDFKKFINVTKTVDKSKLDQLSDLGDITPKDIEGCYSVRETSSFLQVGISKE